MTSLTFRDLRKLELVRRGAAIGVVKVSFDPRPPDVNVPDRLRAVPMATVRLSHGFRTHLHLDMGGFRQRLTLHADGEVHVAVPWRCVFAVICPAAPGEEPLGVPFPDDAPPDLPGLRDHGTN